MSEKNRRAMYDKLVKEGRLSQDDGSLEREFGKQEVKTDGTRSRPSKRN